MGTQTDADKVQGVHCVLYTVQCTLYMCQIFFRTVLRFLDQGLRLWIRIISLRRIKKKPWIWMFFGEKMETFRTIKKKFEKNFGCRQE